VGVQCAWERQGDVEGEGDKIGREIKMEIWG